MATLLQDLKYGLRMLAKNPGFTLVAVVTLALGVGANTAIFSVVNGVLLRPLPFPSPGRLAMVYMHFSPQNQERGTMCLADFLDWREQNRAFEIPAAFLEDRFDLTGVGEPTQIHGSYVTASFFSTLNVRPLVGRTFLSGEDGATSPCLAVLSESLWRSRFGSSPQALGRAIRLNDTSCTVVGVMPATFRFPREDDEVWTNLNLQPPTRRGPFFLRGLGRLKPGATFEQAQAETNAIGRRIERENPTNYSHLSLPVVPLQEAIVGNVRPALLVLMGAVVFVLLISTVNVASLLLARATVREREMSIRRSLGAGRGRLLRQLLSESVLLGLAGGAAGLLVASQGIEILRRWNPGNIPRVEAIQLDSRVLLFTLLVSLISGILFGLAPAWQSSRGDLNASLKEGGRTGGAGSARRRTHGWLVISEIALSVILLIGAGLLLRSFVRLQNSNPGFTAPPDEMLSLAISPSTMTSASYRTRIQFYERLLERVKQLPGVRSAALADSLPPNRRAESDTFVIEGQALPPGKSNPALTAAIVSPDYFRTLGIPLVKGRYFEASDTVDSPPVAVISRSMARRFFPNQDPLGKRFKQSSGPPALPWTPYMRVVGVVADSKFAGVAGEPEAGYYRSSRQMIFDSRMYLVARTEVSAASMVPALRREIEAMDPNTVLSQVATMEQAIQNSVAAPRFRTLLLALLGGLALLMAAVGLYGVISYSVAQRTHEIGIRVALGAERKDVLGLVLRQGLELTLAGVAAGLAGALVLTRFLSSLLYQVKPTDFVTFAGVSLILAGVAFAASYIPARRATNVDPIVALRYE